MHKEFRLKHFLASLAATALIATIVTTSVMSTQKNLEELSAMIHARTTLMEVSELKADLMDLESGQRGYLITGNLRYLESFRETERRVQQRLNLIDSRTGTLPEAQAGLHAIRRLFTEKRVEMNRSIEIRNRSGFDAAKILIESNHGKDLMDQLRDEIRSVQHQLSTIMAVKQASTFKSLKRTNTAIVACGILAIGGGAVFSWMLFLFLRKQAQQQRLEAQKDAVDERNRLIEVLAHDLKNPLGAVRFSARLLSERPQLDEKIAKLSAMISDATDRSIGIVDSLLQMRDLEDAKGRLQAAELNLDELVEQVIENFSLRARDKSIRIGFTRDKSVEVRADRGALLRVIENLVSNAVKFSPPGTTVAMTVERDGDTATFVIEDEGPGIPPEERSRLFQRYARLTPRPTSDETSTGLGLYIVKELVEAMKGTIRFRPAPSGGAGFVLRMPLA